MYTEPTPAHQDLPSTPHVVVLPTDRTTFAVIEGLIRECRPKQWTKNVLLFFGLIFALKLNDIPILERACAGFAVFCAVSSGIYLLNDLADLEKDRQHPIKRKRPLASGVVRPSELVPLAVVLLVGGVVAAYALGPLFAGLTLFYVVLNVAYSFSLKHVVLIDVFAIAAGFVTRAVAGAVVVNVPISPWLYVCTILASLFLGFGKRRHELVLLESGASNHRPSLQQYTPELLDQLIMIVTSTTVMAYSLYTFSAENLPGNHAMMITIPLVLYGIFRYLYLMHVHNIGGSPDEALLHDRPLLATVVLWILTSVLILYLAPGHN